MEVINGCTMANILGAIIGYGFVVLMILGIAYVAHFFITPQSTLSGKPDLTGSWVTQFFQTVSTNRNQQYSECTSLDSYAGQRYAAIAYSGSTNYNETILAPLELYTDYIDGVASSTTYGVQDPSTYLQNLEYNESDVYSTLMGSSYSYYGYYIFNTTGTFGSSNQGVLSSGNTTVPTMHVLIELSSTCS